MPSIQSADDAQKEEKWGHHSKWPSFTCNLGIIEDFAQKEFKKKSILKSAEHLLIKAEILAL